MPLKIFNDPMAVGKMPISQVGQNLVIKGTPHAKIEDLKIKGEHHLNYLPHTEPPFFNTSIDTHNGTLSKIGPARYLLDNTSGKAQRSSWRYSAYLSDTLRTVLKPRTWYTLNYHIHKMNNKKDLNMYVYDTNATVASYELEKKEEGFNYLNIEFRYLEPGKTVSLFGFNIRSVYFDPINPEYLDIEFLNLVEGKDNVIPYTLGETGGIENIRIHTQEYSPVLGEYQVGGDIPKVLTTLETGIVTLENAFKTTWR